MLRRANNFNSCVFAPSCALFENLSVLYTSPQNLAAHLTFSVAKLQTQLSYKVFFVKCHCDGAVSAPIRFCVQEVVTEASPTLTKAQCCVHWFVLKRLQRAGMIAENNGNKRISISVYIFVLMASMGSVMIHHDTNAALAINFFLALKSLRVQALSFQ